MKTIKLQGQNKYSTQSVMALIIKWGKEQNENFGCNEFFKS